MKRATLVFALFALFPALLAAQSATPTCAVWNRTQGTPVADADWTHHGTGTLGLLQAGVHTLEGNSRRSAHPLVMKPPAVWQAENGAR